MPAVLRSRRQSPTYGQEGVWHSGTEPAGPAACLALPSAVTGALQEPSAENTDALWAKEKTELRR